MDGQKGFAVSPALFSCLVMMAAIGCSEDPTVMSPIGAAGSAGTSTLPAAGGGGTAVAGSTAAGSSAAGSTAAGSSAAGGGAAGMAAPGGAMSCPTAPTAAPSALHMAAAVALLPTTNQGPCSFGSCHDANAKKAGLVLTGMPLDLKAQTVGKLACEVPTMMLVDASGGDAALAKSWLWLKLAAPADSSGVVTPKPEWGSAATSCGQGADQAFGVRMPFSGTDTQLSMEKLTAVRDWICAGAPGP
jgi:hypothetical protein